MVKIVSGDSSLGAAMLAGIAVGVFEDAKAAVEACVKVDTITKPSTKNHRVYEEIFEEYVAVHDALAPIYHKRSGFHIDGNSEINRVVCYRWSSL